jgi:hemoglobin
MTLSKLTGAPTMHAPLFERFGGMPQVSRLVLEFYDRVLESERLKPFFAHADMRRLVEHQAKFIASVMGGPTRYSDSELRTIHSHLGVDEGAFEEMIDIFAETLGRFEIDPAEAERVVSDLRLRRDYVVTAGKL